MLDELYGDLRAIDDYRPASAGVNRDVLALGMGFALPRLVECAAMWLTQDVSTSNVQERLATCDEFGLAALRDQIANKVPAHVASPVAQLPSPNQSPLVTKKKNTSSLQELLKQ